MVPITRTIQALGGAAGAVEEGNGNDDPDVPDARGSLGMERERMLPYARNACVCVEAEPFLWRAS